MQLITLSDFFRERFGLRAEKWSAVLMVPTYFGWIAAQFVALAGLLHVVFGLEPWLGIALVAIVGTAYTLLGGMWSVTLTDAVQMALVAIGLVVLTTEVLTTLGHGSAWTGLQQMWRDLPPDRAALIPTEKTADVVGWLGVLAIGALGNLPGQDLTQRVFASRSARTAVWACYLAGASYLVLGAFPIVMGLAADQVAPQTGSESTLTVLAGLFLTPVLSALLLLAVASSVLSTIDSAILSPATVLSENLFGARNQPPKRRLASSRYAVLGVAAVSCIVAYVGTDAYELLEDAYAFGLVSLLVPLLAGVHGRRAGESAALWAMGIGTTVFAVHFVAGWDTFLGPALERLPVPTPLTCTALAAIAYVVVARAGPATAQGQR
jgi:Na+/proline symporter